MEKPIFDLFSKSDPLDQILAITPAPVVGQELNAMIISTNNILNSMVEFWDSFETLYQAFNESDNIEDDLETFRSMARDINKPLIAMHAAVCLMFKATGISGATMLTYLTPILKSQGLEAIVFNSNSLKTAIALGNHLLTHKEMFDFNRGAAYTVMFNGAYDNRMGSRGLGDPIYEMAHKTSNEMFVSTQRLKQLSVQHGAGKISASEYQNQMPNLFLSMYCSLALHFSLLRCEDLYINKETYDLL